MKNKRNILSILMLSVSLLSGCNKNNNSNIEITDSLFETGYDDVTIDKDFKASRGTVYGFYKDAAFKEEIDVTKKIDVSKIYVKMLVGDGSFENPYLIGSANSLNSLTHLGREITGNAVLTNDFTVSSLYSDDYTNTIFNGTFDGKNHHIHLDEENIGTTGLFYKIGENGHVMNVKIHGPIEAMYASTGALCNYNDGLIENVYTYGTTLHASNGYNNGVSLMTVWDEDDENVIVDHGTVGKLDTLSKGGAGGIAGTNNGNIKDCVNYMNVRATIGAGGIAGINNGNITCCFNKGAVGTTGNNSVNSTTIRDHDFDFSYLGGMAGANFGTISQCVNANQIFVARLPWKFDDAPAGQSDYIDRIRVGGIAGYNCGTYDESTNEYTKGIITECANYGRVHGDMQGGGIAGYSSGVVTNCEVISPIGARSCLGGVVGWQSGDKPGDRYGIVNNCIAITRVAAGSAQSVQDAAGNAYTAVKLAQLSSSVSTTNIDEYYHIAKYATNCVYHNYGGVSKPIDPSTMELDANSTNSTATMATTVKDVVNGDNKWAPALDNPTENVDVTAIVGFNTSWQAFLNIYLAFQAKTITYVVDGVEHTIKGVAGIDYINTVVAKSGSTWVSGLASNYSAAIKERGLPTNPITLGTDQELIWVTTEGDASTKWDGLLTDDITVYPMAVSKEGVA